MHKHGGEAHKVDEHQRREHGVEVYDRPPLEAADAADFYLGKVLAIAAQALFFEPALCRRDANKETYNDADKPRGHGIRKGRYEEFLKADSERRDDKEKERGHHEARARKVVFDGEVDRNDKDEKDSQDCNSEDYGGGEMVHADIVACKNASGSGALRNRLLDFN